MAKTPDSPDGNEILRESTLAAFRALVLADEALQARLGAIDRPELYIVEAVAVAAAHGIALAAEAIGDAILPIGRPKPDPITLDRWPPRGWLPIRAVGTDAALAFDWAWFGAQALDAPFYEEMIGRFAPRPFNRMFRMRTDLATLVDTRDAAAGPVPAGFIHHMSRCGSTLVAQMLGADPRHVVLCEPAPLDAVVRWALRSGALSSGAPLDDQVAALRAIVAALGRDRSGQTRRVVFKLDSWHAVALPLFRAAFPETPWVFLYRNPVEILVSQRRQRGIHTVPGLLPASIVDIPGGADMAADRYTACVLTRIGEAVLDFWPLDHWPLDQSPLRHGPSARGLLVDYAAMPDAIIDRIAPHFGFVPDAAVREAMRQVATRNAKAPNQRFTPDTVAKRRDVTPEIEAARALVDPVYVQLEALRKSLESSSAPEQ